MSQNSDNQDKDKLQPKAPVRLESIERLRSISLPVALGIGVAVAAVLVTVGMGLYLSSNLSRIDLSKPKYSEARNDVEDFSKKQEEYSSGGPVDKQSIKEAITILQERQKELREIGDFTESALSNKALDLGK